MRIICAWLVMVSVACGQLHLYSGGAGVSASYPVEVSNTNFTLSTWINPQTFSTYRETIIVGFSSTYEFQFTNYPDTNTWLFGYYSGGYRDHRFPTAWTPANEWTHLAITFSTSSVNVYINGNVATNFVNSWGSIRPSSMNLSIGGHWQTGSDAILADTRIFNRILSASEISELHTCPYVLTDDPDLVLRTCVVTNNTGDALTGVARNYGTGADGTYSNSPIATPWTIQMEQPQRATINID